MPPRLAAVFSNVIGPSLASAKQARQTLERQTDNVFDCLDGVLEPTVRLKVYNPAPAPQPPR